MQCWRPLKALLSGWSRILALFKQKSAKWWFIVFVGREALWKGFIGSDKLNSTHLLWRKAICKKTLLPFLSTLIRFDGALAVHYTWMLQVEEETKLKAPHLFASAQEPPKCTVINTKQKNTNTNKIYKHKLKRKLSWKLLICLQLHTRWGANSDEYKKQIQKQIQNKKIQIQISWRGN